MKQKGQAGIEALFAIGVIVILFIGIYAVYNDKSRNLLAVEQELRQREVCVGLANDIVSVFTLGEGTEKTRRLEYNVTIQPQQQRINLGKSFCTLTIGLVSSEGPVTGTPFNIGEGIVKIKNVNQSVRIQNE